MSEATPTSFRRTGVRSRPLAGSDVAGSMRSEAEQAKGAVVVGCRIPLSSGRCRQES